MKNTKKTYIRNNTKNRKATPNEIAKYMILDMLDSMCAVQERFGCEDLTDAEADEVLRHYEKHARSIGRRFNNDDLEVILPPFTYS